MSCSNHVISLDAKGCAVMTALTCWREKEDYIAAVIAEYPTDFADLVSPYVVDAISSQLPT